MLKGAGGANPQNPIFVLGRSYRVFGRATSGKHERRKLRWIAILPVLNKPGRLGHLRCTLSRYKASIITSGAEHRSRLTSRDSARTHVPQLRELREIDRDRPSTLLIS